MYNSKDSNNKPKKFYRNLAKIKERLNEVNDQKKVSDQTLDCIKQNKYFFVDFGENSNNQLKLADEKYEVEAINRVVGLPYVSRQSNINLEYIGKERYYKRMQSKTIQKCQEKIEKYKRQKSEEDRLKKERELHIQIQKQLKAKNKKQKSPSNNGGSDQKSQQFYNLKSPKNNQNITSIQRRIKANSDVSQSVTASQRDIKEKETVKQQENNQSQINIETQANQQNVNPELQQQQNSLYQNSIQQKKEEKLVTQNSEISENMNCNTYIKQQIQDNIDIETQNIKLPNINPNSLQQQQQTESQYQDFSKDNSVTQLINDLNDKNINIDNNLQDNLDSMQKASTQPNASKRNLYDDDPIIQGLREKHFKGELSLQEMRYKKWQKIDEEEKRRKNLIELRRKQKNLLKFEFERSSHNINRVSQQIFSSNLQQNGQINHVQNNIRKQQKVLIQQFYQANAPQRMVLQLKQDFSKIISNLDPLSSPQKQQTSQLN